MTLKEKVLKLQTYKMFEGEDTVYVERDDILELLEQEPCEDAVSRQALIDTIESWLLCDDYNEAERHIMRAMQSVLYDLPPVTPLQRIGHWILTIEDWNKWTCSECGFTRRTDIHVKLGYNFCPKCGAKMESEE